MSIPTRIVKAHGTGNDFVAYIDAEGSYEPTVAETTWLCDRHRGVGGDGLLRLTHPRYVSDLTVVQVQALETAHTQWFMDYRNADGSHAEMCGNGTRVMALMAQQAELVSSDGPFLLGTRAGVKRLEPVQDDPVLGTHVFRVDMGAWRCGGIGDYRVTIPGTSGSARGTFVDMGNPHVVSVIEAEGCRATHGDDEQVGSVRTADDGSVRTADDGSVRTADDGSVNGLLTAHDDAWRAIREQAAVSDLPPVAKLDLMHKPVVAPVLESDQNAEFVRVGELDGAHGCGTAFMRVNERGVGETLSCGTGLCATGVVLYRLTGLPHWDISVLGGTLRVDVSDSAVTLTGSATLVGIVDLMERGGGR